MGKLHAVILDNDGGRTLMVVDDQELVTRWAREGLDRMSLSVGAAERVRRQIEGEEPTRVYRIPGQPETRLSYQGEELVVATGALAAKYLKRVHEEAEPLVTDLPDRRVAELVVGRSGSKAVTQDGTPSIVAAFVEEYIASAAATPGEVDLLRPILEEIREAARLEARDRERRVARVEARQARQEAQRELERAQSRLEQYQRMHGFEQVSDAQLAAIRKEVQEVETAFQEAERALRATEGAADGS